MNTTEYYKASIKCQEEAVDQLTRIKTILFFICLCLGFIIGARL